MFDCMRYFFVLDCYIILIALVFNLLSIKLSTLPSKDQTSSLNILLKQKSELSDSSHWMPHAMTEYWIDIWKKWKLSRPSPKRWKNWCYYYRLTHLLSHMGTKIYKTEGKLALNLSHSVETFGHQLPSHKDITTEKEKKSCISFQKVPSNN